MAIGKTTATSFMMCMTHKPVPDAHADDSDCSVRETTLCTQLLNTICCCKDNLLVQMLLQGPTTLSDKEAQISVVDYVFLE